jgi:tetratricopeptide (TPR) repeat protein
MNESIQFLEKQLKDALIAYEQQEKYELALEKYKSVENEIHRLIEDGEGEIGQAYQLLAQCYLRQAGMLRQLGMLDEASKINKKEIESARLSGSSITYAQSLFSTGINLLSNRQMEEGLHLLIEAKKSFEEGDSIDHKQGVGWYWIILADLGNKKLINVTSEEIIHFASEAIDILTEIQNAPGISRAYQARAIAYQNIGNNEKAEDDKVKSKLL